ncbi:unnamed protein product, partial [Meganyctiphanes norvegica]
MKHNGRNKNQVKVISNKIQHQKMSLVCCNIKFRTKVAFQDHRTIHTRGSQVFECRKCTFKCPKLHMMVAHNFVHEREKIAVRQEESKLVNKPWVVPKLRNNPQRGIQLTVDNSKRNDDMQKCSHQDDNTSTLEDLDVDSSESEETNSLSTLDRDLNSDKNDSYSSGSEDTRSLSTLYRDSDSSRSEEPRRVSTLDRDLDINTNDLKVIDREENLDSCVSEDTGTLSTLDRDLVSDKKYSKVIDSEKNSVERKQMSNSGDLANKNSESLVKKFTCLICDTVFQEESLFKKHVRIHFIDSNLESNISRRTNIFRFACVHCQFKCKYIDEYDLHKKTHYKNEAHVCKKCPRNFETKSHLQRHYIKVHKTYICQLCPFKSRHNNDLKNHLSLIHSGKKGSYLTNYSDLNVKKDFNTANTSDDSVKKYSKSLTCEKSFSCKKYLQENIKVHSNEKPFQCAFCSFKSRWKSNLNIHMEKHNKHLQQEELSIDNSQNEESKSENIFHCKICKYQTKDYLSLKIHIEDNHPITDTTKYVKAERLFPCNFCEYISKFPENVNRHTLRHHKYEIINTGKDKKFKRIVIKNVDEN